MEYDIIYSDPPWEQQKSNLRKARSKQKKLLDYPTLPISEIAQIHKRFSEQTSQQHNFFVWTIDKFLHETENMMKDLGYQLHARMIWDKTNGIAPAFTIRFAHEYLLWFYKKGKMLMPAKEMRGKYTSVLRETAIKHSKKPQFAYEMLENLFPNTKRIELFARTIRDNWDSWGNEIRTGSAEDEM